MFEIDICFINRNNDELPVNIEFNNLQSQDLQYFDISPANLKTASQNIIIPAYESAVYKIFMSPTVGGRELKLPKIVINSKVYSLNKHFEIKPIKCLLSKENRLIGEVYNKIVSNFNDEVMQNSIAFALYGGSGVGKSRLFMECVKKCVIKNYIILNYSAGYHTTNHMDDAENLIKGIIIALYDLTDEEILNMFNKIAINMSVNLDVNTFPAFQMIKDFMSADTSAQYISLIDKYIDVLSRKLSQHKYLIAVDNIQFFDECIAYFFHKILSSLINSNATKKSIILLTFNTDYMRNDSLCTELLLYLKENHPMMKKEKIIGFQSDEECEVYLQESLSIGDSMGKDDIKKVIQKTSRNPFYLEQMILWLHEKGVLEVKNGNYIVNKPEELLDKMNDIPKEISEIIRQRWDYYITSHSENKALQILSAIHLYSSLSMQSANLLNLNWKIIESMEKSGFLNIQSNDGELKAVFYHDIIEKFFIEQYFPLCKYICEYELSNNLSSRKLEYQRSLFELCKNTELDVDIVRNYLSINIPVKLAGEFYYLLCEYYRNSFEQFTDKNQWMFDVTQLVGKIRDHQGNAMMLSFANSIESMLNQKHYLNTEMCYGRFLLTIGETLDSIGRYKEAHDRILYYKDQIELLDSSTTQKKFLAELYNRLHVYRRHQCEYPLEDSLTKEYIEKAIKLSVETNFYEMEYVNNSDMGYLYYSLPITAENAKQTLHYWKKACKIFENYDIPSKTLNYIRKCVQIALLCKSSDDAIRKCNEGLKYIDYGKYSYQKLFFRWWFTLALAEGYLQNISVKNLDIVNECLNKAQEYADLLKTNKKYYVLFLRAIYFYYKESTKKSIEYFTKCAELLTHTTYRSKMMSLIDQTTANKKTVLEQHFSDIRKEKNLTSQITTQDGLFNLICL